MWADRHHPLVSLSEGKPAIIFPSRARGWWQCELCLCQACNAWARRQMKRPIHQGVGDDEPARKDTRTLCEIEGCGSPKHGQISSNAALCSKHYREEHRKENEVRCFICGKRQGTGQRFHRPLNVQRLQKGVLSDAGQDTLSRARLCGGCHAKEQRESDLQSSDAALEQLIADQLKHASDMEDPIKAMKAEMTARVAQALRKKEGIQLSDIYEQFNEMLVDNGEEAYTRSSYLMTHLRRQLGDKLETRYIKEARLAGYLLLRKGCDVHHALYCALHDRINKTNTSVDVERKPSDQATAASNADLESSVMERLNLAVLQQAKRWAEIGQQPGSHATLDLQQTIADVDPRLWSMVSTLTQAKYTKGLVDPKEDTSSAKSKSLPCLLLLSVMAHLAHPPCNYPLHFAVSDYVDSHRGSSDLLQLLSRLGVCSRRDTFQRMKTRVVGARVSEGLGEEVLTGAFSITSIDNIDRAAPGQRITQAGQSRGFHSTSVQHIAPKPLTCRLTEEEQLSTPMATVSTASVFTAGVRSTPAPHSRTLRVSVATASSQLLETVDHSVLNAASTQDGLATVTQADIQQLSTPLYRPPQTDKRPLNEEVVELTNAERLAMKELQGRIFSYMVARRQAGVEGTECQGLKDLLAMQVPDSSQEELISHHDTRCPAWIGRQPGFPEGNTGQPLQPVWYRDPRQNAHGGWRPEDIYANAAPQKAVWSRSGLATALSRGLACLEELPTRACSPLFPCWAPANGKGGRVQRE